jgi:hypothetical protein
MVCGKEQYVPQGEKNTAAVQHVILLSLGNVIGPNKPCVQ